MRCIYRLALAAFFLLPAVQVGGVECPSVLTLNHVSGTLYGDNVSQIGDITVPPDGYGDYIIGAPFESGGAGAAFVYSGKDGALIRSHLRPTNPSWMYARFGHSVSDVGLFDGDNVPDYAVGGFQAMAYHDGGFVVYSGATGNVLYMVVAPLNSTDSLGFAISDAGDVDHDGRVDDFLVGAPGHDLFNAFGAGRVRAYTGPNLTIRWEVYGDHPGQGLGIEVANAGDVNNDGCTDFAVASRDGSPIRVYSGATGMVLFSVSSPSYADRRKGRVDGIGDINNDGFDDIVVGYRPLDKATVYYGPSGASSSNIFVPGTSGFGHRVAGGGTITDDDNIPDVLISEIGGQYSNITTVFVISGATLLPAFAMDAQVFGTGFGDAIGSAGDTDNDGFDNILIGEPSTATVKLMACTDADNDGIFDCNDNCPTVANADQADGDADGIGNVCDNCVSVANADQADADSDGDGNVCDNCPTTSNPDQADGDGDGDGTACDNCPFASNPTQADFDQDGIGDVCDPCTDSDGDGYGNPGYPNAGCQTDNCPTMNNPAQGSCCDAAAGWVLPHTPGDVTCDGGTDISDLTRIIDYLFGPYTLPCPMVQAADFDCDGSVDVSDLTVLVDYLFNTYIPPCNVCDCYDAPPQGQCP